MTLDPARKVGQKPARRAGFRSDGASRTRTGDLLGAISALSLPEFGLTSALPSLRVSSPNSFPNTLQPVLQSDNAHHWDPSGRQERRPVTPEVAVASPLVVYERVEGSFGAGSLPFDEASETATAGAKRPR